MAEAPAGSPSPRHFVTISPENPQPPAHQITEPGQFIQADPDLRDNDADSAASASGIYSTESLTESIYAYRMLQGRTYNAPRTSEYWAPNDEQQNEGLNLLHHCLLMVLDDKLFLAPIDDHPQHVLDVGTGTGVWAIDFGDMYPSAEVIGTDLSPIQPAWVPPNVHFQIDDCLQDWTWPEDHFDFVHIRMLYGSVSDWSQLYRRAYRHLKPGGWVQDLEMEVRIQSDHHVFPEDHIFNEWARFNYEGGDKMGRTFEIACGHTMKDTMEAAGFIDVTEIKLKAPCHSWPSDPKLKEAGLIFFAMLDQSLEGFIMYLFTKALGWTPDEVLVFAARMRAEIRKKSNCGWILTTVVFGRKPETAEAQG